MLSALLSRLTPTLFAFLVFLQSKAATKKAGATKRKFTVDFSVPANDGVFDGAALEEYLKERIKVEGKTGNLVEKVKVSREGVWCSCVS